VRRRRSRFAAGFPSPRSLSGWDAAGGHRRRAVRPVLRARSEKNCSDQAPRGQASFFCRYRLGQNKGTQRLRADPSLSGSGNRLRRCAESCTWHRQLFPLAPRANNLAVKGAKAFGPASPTKRFFRRPHIDRHDEGGRRLRPGTRDKTASYRKAVSAGDFAHANGWIWAAGWAPVDP